MENLTKLNEKEAAMENLTKFKLNRRRWAVQLALTTGLALLFLAGLLCGLRGVTPVRANPDILYVDADAAGAHNGTSWTNAYTNVQDSLTTVISGTEVWVAEGVYYPDDGIGQINDSVNSTFVLTDGVALYGGFAATETLRTQRDWETNVTVLSGDIDGNDTTDPDSVVTDTANIAGSNAYHVISGNGADNTATIDGFTITAGQANGSYIYPDCGPACGGGMFNSQSSPALTNVTFSGNSADSGGGVYNYASNPTLTNVTFSNNSGDYGGGMFNARSGPVLTNVTFSNNSGDYGGGMFNNSSSHIQTNVTFSDNSATYKGGGMCNWNASWHSLTDMVFINNSADYGGGMYNYNGGSPGLTNAIFSGNSATTDGGGMYNLAGSSPWLTNVTFSNNSAEYDGGGMYNESFSNPTLRNIILWGNVATTTATSQISNTMSSTPTISYSDIQGSGGSGSWDTSLGADGSGNIDADPIFISEYDNLRLQSGSPAIDAGANVFCPATDLDGNPRPIGSSCDMGAYEFGGQQGDFFIYLPLVLHNH